jgi:hypothetical protein
MDYKILRGNAAALDGFREKADPIVRKVDGPPDQQRATRPSNRLRHSRVRARVERWRQPVLRKRRTRRSLFQLQRRVRPSVTAPFGRHRLPSRDLP